MLKTLLCLYVFILTAVTEEPDPRSENGYPRGLMSVCPGSNKTASISKSQLKYISFIVQGNGRTRQTYTYWDAKNIAKDPRINFKRKTVLVAIGYLDSPTFPISLMFANEYEDLGYNVIILDNQRFSTVHYHLAARLMRPVGKHVAEVLVQLTQQSLDPANLELLGFSLGGHTVSYIARNYQQMSGKNISRIVAIEPSGPCFRTIGPGDRLDASNADLVVAIHTNIDGYGMANRMGHVDFYVNGGEFQPSDINFYPCTTLCSHFRVLTLWVTALKNPGKFVGIKCKSIQQARDAECYSNVPIETNVMGMTVDKNKPGIFYLSTSLGFPYYLGMKGLREKYAYWKRITNINDGDDIDINV